jgi:hypothetical protein
MNFTHASGEQWSQGCLWAPRVRFALDGNNSFFSGIYLDWFENRIGRYLPSCDDLGVPPVCGRLGQSVEGGGKRRIFAIGNYVNQRLLQPFHDWLMALLKRLPMDGTFNQMKPLDLLGGKQCCYSFDLKSATDRWPLVFLFEMIAALFDRSFASSVVNSTLACNLFEVPFVKRRNSTVSFVAGTKNLITAYFCTLAHTITFNPGLNSE